MVLVFKMDITKPTLLGQLEKIKWKCVYTVLSIVPHIRAHLSVFFSGLLCPNMVVSSAQYDPIPSQFYSLRYVVFIFTELCLPCFGNIEVTAEGLALETAQRESIKMESVVGCVPAKLTETEGASREWPAGVGINSSWGRRDRIRHLWDAQARLHEEHCCFYTFKCSQFNPIAVDMSGVQESVITTPQQMALLWNS